MEFTVDQNELHRMVGLAQNCVGKKTTMPILSNLLITAQAGALRIAASDLELTVVIQTPAEVRSSGSTTVSAKMFSDIVRELPAGKVTIRRTENERVEILCGGSKFKVLGVSAEEYPSLPSSGSKLQSVISSGQLSDMITKTIYATSLDETRANMSGVCFEVEGAGKKQCTLKLVATDGHRLSLVSRPAAEFKLDQSIIVPRRALNEIKKALDAAGDVPVKLAVSNGLFELEVRDTRFSARLSDSAFPSYSRVIPEEKGDRARVPTEQLSQALRRSLLMVSDRNKCVQLRFSGSELEITSSSPDLGEASEQIPIQYTGSEVRLGINAGFVQEIINSVPGVSTICLDLHGDSGPVKVCSEDDESYVAIVMPMRIM